jgi:hypothetical protein
LQSECRELVGTAQELSIRVKYILSDQRGRLAGINCGLQQVDTRDVFILLRTILHFVRALRRWILGRVAENAENAPTGKQYS